jgi:hypothetical protein
VRHGLLETVCVDRVGGQRQQVARGAGGDHLAVQPGAGQRPAQLRHPDLQGVRGVGGQVLAPEGVGEGVRRDDPAGGDRQPGEHGAHRRRR